MILSDVGEIGISYEGLELFLSPSYDMSSLGNGKEIVDIFTRVMSGDLAYSLAVIQVCADGDIRDVFGYIDEDLVFHEKAASINEIIIVAQSLMKHGLIGDIKRTADPTSMSEYTKEFDAKEYVATAVAHLGVSIKDAWAMTMTSLVGALQSKFPPEPSKYMSEERENELMEWFESSKKSAVEL